MHCTAPKNKPRPGAPPPAADQRQCAAPVLDMYRYTTMYTFTFPARAPSCYTLGEPKLARFPCPALVAFSFPLLFPVALPTQPSPAHISPPLSPFSQPRDRSTHTLQTVRAYQGPRDTSTYALVMNNLSNKNAVRQRARERMDNPRRHTSKSNTFYPRPPSRSLPPPQRRGRWCAFPKPFPPPPQPILLPWERPKRARYLNLA